MKRALFIVLVMAAGWGLTAQEALTGANFPGAIAKSIVRAYTGASSLGYVEAGGRHFFTLDDGASSIVGVEIDSLLTVHDFVVHGDYVYFCGENHISRAFVGWFKTQTFLSGQSDYFLFGYIPLPGLNHVKSLSSICVYDHLDSTRIMSVGCGDNGRACIVYATGMEGFASNWRCIGGVSPHQSERMLRVCETENYLVTAGTIFNDHDGVSLRAFGKRDPFAPGGTQERYHRYSSEDSNPLIDFPLTDSSSTELALTHMNGDSVAVMAEWGLAFGVEIDPKPLTNAKNRLCPLLTNQSVVDFYEVAPMRRMGTSIEYDCQP